LPVWKYPVTLLFIEPFNMAVMWISRRSNICFWLRIKAVLCIRTSLRSRYVYIQNNEHHMDDPLMQNDLLLIHCLYLFIWLAVVSLQALLQNNCGKRLLASSVLPSVCPHGNISVPSGRILWFFAYLGVLRKLNSFPIVVKIRLNQTLWPTYSFNVWLPSVFVTEPDCVLRDVRAVSYGDLSSGYRDWVSYRDFSNGYWDCGPYRGLSSGYGGLFLPRLTKWAPGVWVLPILSGYQRCGSYRDLASGYGVLGYYGD
jgi:hypothetical protein